MLTNFLRLASRSYIFSASLPASVVDGVRIALRELLQRSGFARTAQLEGVDRRSSKNRIRPLNIDRPIIAAKIGDVEQAFELWKSLLRRGICANLIVPPQSPDDATMLRVANHISVSHVNVGMVPSR